jgi:hypothetical protein
MWPTLVATGTSRVELRYSTFFILINFVAIGIDKLGRKSFLTLFSRASCLDGRMDRWTDKVLATILLYSTVQHVPVLYTWKLAAANERIHRYTHVKKSVVL